MKFDLGCNGVVTHLMRDKIALIALPIVGLSFVLGIVFFSGDRNTVSQTAAFSVPGEPGMTVDAAHQAFYKLMPALLLVVYDAFAKTEEDQIYDTLASVSHGDALERLYLERIGAMADGGLEEVDQTIHEIKLLGTTVERDNATLHIDASWQVIGTVGHAEHLHVRGNTYRADLTVAPVDTAWRITEFDLLEVSRDAAGEMFPAE